MKNDHKLLLKDISTDENIHLRSWQPSHEEISIHLTLEIGYADLEKGINYFYVFVASPEALLKNNSQSDNFLLADRATLLISYYDYNKLVQTIESILAKSSKYTFEDSCVALLKYFDWEYDNMK